MHRLQTAPRLMATLVLVVLGCSERATARSTPVGPDTPLAVSESGAQ
jgi:hypothetical protein